ncbi:hypothetical protein [Microbacterium stercoris]|uniref:Fibronectin type-III domain-containing protein n=1 Tax=Microbacterium stercoris TaxID=2820289 RepID=A0A939QH63_9MICO|nr:hypothetical protein [Microbacterium stercoris]MBO3662869.1 hypothetical protein [Microbacterium stercoris]
MSILSACSALAADTDAKADRDAPTHVEGTASGEGAATGATAKSEGTASDIPGDDGASATAGASGATDHPEAVAVCPQPAAWASDITQNTITVEWSLPEGAIYDHVRVEEPGSGIDYSVVMPADQRSYTVTSLASGSQTTTTIYVVCADGSRTSAEVTEWTLGGRHEEEISSMAVAYTAGDAAGTAE